MKNPKFCPWHLPLVATINSYKWSITVLNSQSQDSVRFTAPSCTSPWTQSHHERRAGFPGEQDPEEGVQPSFKWSPDEDSDQRIIRPPSSPQLRYHDVIMIVLCQTIFDWPMFGSFRQESTPETDVSRGSRRPTGVFPAWYCENLTNAEGPIPESNQLLDPSNIFFSHHHEILLV